MESGWIDHEEHVPGVSGKMRRPGTEGLHGDGAGVGVSDSDSSVAGWDVVGGNWPSSDWPLIDSKAPSPTAPWKQT